ncbi:unnamed protein product [Aphis gossypii]|uniref:Uncharacterized protein n=1 Tax=Aphis gossypii TaxID=80765 RepID=A0A9P0J6D1_APHGO|nr:unnamed protein product [Aphis gossypii]
MMILIWNLKKIFYFILGFDICYETLSLTLFWGLHSKALISLLVLPLLLEFDSSIIHLYSGMYSTLNITILAFRIVEPINHQVPIVRTQIDLIIRSYGIEHIKNVESKTKQNSELNFNRSRNSRGWKRRDYNSFTLNSNWF